MKWRILGIENGNILITTDEVVFDKNSKAFYLKGKLGYQNGVEELNKIGAIYGHGKYAVSGRNMNNKDFFGSNDWIENPRQYTMEIIEKDGYKSIKLNNTTLPGCSDGTYFDEESNEWKTLQVGEKIVITETTMGALSIGNKIFKPIDKSFWLADRGVTYYNYAGEFDYYINIVGPYNLNGGGFYLYYNRF